MEVIPYSYKYNKICCKCIMDDSVQGISFDKQGVCSFCKIHDELDQKYPLNDATPDKLNSIIKTVKKAGKRKKYDCIVGVSGGRDSTYTLYKCVELGLRPLAVHFDNGWNSESAVRNIENACKLLNVDLHTHVANWEEFKDLQRSFFFASVPDVEVPTDWVLRSVLYQVAIQYGIKHFVVGTSFRTEGTTPVTWTYQDDKYIKSIHKAFGSLRIKSFPIVSIFTIFYNMMIRRMHEVRLLYYLPYNEREVMATITDKLGWIDYGGKHHESTFTSFFQSYYLVRKFNIDKRKLHYSALIRAKQMVREEALDLIRIDPFNGTDRTLEYVCKKLDFTEADFISILRSTPKSFLDYKSHYGLILKCEPLVRFMTLHDLLPAVIYQKYFAFFRSKSNG